MYKFIKTHDDENRFDQTDIEMTVVHNEQTVTDLIEVFEAFLFACGFHFEGQLDIVEDDDAAEKG